jgi:AraC-like DNA-binding protein
MALLNKVSNSQIIYDNMNEVKLNSCLVFQSAELISSFHRDEKGHGYLIYFTSDCFSFFKPELEKEFPFFDVQQTHFFDIDQEKFNEFSADFEDVFQTYEKSKDRLHPAARAKLLALFYQLRDFVDTGKWQERIDNPHLVLLKKFVQLVNDNYIEKRTVGAYADMLSISPKHLSRSIKSASGKKALAFINDRVISEAKSLILYTDLNITEICYHLNFSDPSNFINFFKKHGGVSPNKFRMQGTR